MKTNVLHVGTNLLDKWKVVPAKIMEGSRFTQQIQVRIAHKTRFNVLSWTSSI
jgi:hypothetical protein